MKAQHHRNAHAIGLDSKSIAEAQRRAVMSQLLNTYGFNLDMVVERQRLELLQRADSVYAVPEQLLTNFEGFPCIAVGMLIGEWHEVDLRAVA